jgi:hypothetical protein
MPRSWPRLPHALLHTGHSLRVCRTVGKRGQQVTTSAFDPNAPGRERQVSGNPITFWLLRSIVFSVAIASDAISRGLFVLGVHLLLRVRVVSHPQLGVAVAIPPSFPSLWDGHGFTRSDQVNPAVGGCQRN